MKNNVNEALFELLRMAVDDDCSPRFFKHRLDENEWQALRAFCHKQLLDAVVYRALCRLPKELQPPPKLMFQWAIEAEIVKGHNKLLNSMAAGFTEDFAARGRKTAVLKGAANARLYPDPFMRQAGDIDLWVEGGRDSVIALVKEMGYKVTDKDASVHHLHIHDAGNGITLEVHYQPAVGTINPIAKARVLRYLNTEIQNVERVPEGFCVPSMKFALVMQLLHIMHHFFFGGIGFKQIVDYCILLKRSTEADRRAVSALLSRFGVKSFCSALMWIMSYVFGLESDRLLCKPNEKAGQKVLAEVYDGGHFGRYKNNGKPVYFKNGFDQWWHHRWRGIRQFRANPSEVIWREIRYCFAFIGTIPRRIKLRRLVLSDVKKKLNE